jgi:hypothetical protein
MATKLKNTLKRLEDEVAGACAFKLILNTLQFADEE